MGNNTLGENVEIIMGQSPPGSSVSKSPIGVPLLNGPTEFGAHHPTPVQFTTDAKKLARPGDILFCVRGSTTGRMNWADQEYAIGRGIAAIRHRHMGSLQSLVRAIIEKELPGLLTQATGSTFPNVTASLISMLPYPELSEIEQRAIAHILGSLDDKIELNHRMNQSLEAMARAIFKSWFVDFDPVRAKAEGRPTGLPDDIAAVFPDSFEDSELGEIPTGWRVLPLSEVVNIIGGGTPKTKVKEYWGGDIPWFSVVDAPTETDVFVIGTEKHITELGVEKSSTKVLRKGTTIISARGTVGKCALVGRPMAMNQSCYGIQGKNGESDYFVYFTIRRQVSDLQRSGHGSVFNTITRDTFKTIRIACPPTNLTTSYEEIVHPLMELVLENLHENATLASLRDILLPKLISGELRVPDAEKFVEEAGV